MGERYREKITHISLIVQRQEAKLRHHTNTVHQHAASRLIEINIDFTRDTQATGSLRRFYSIFSLM